MSQATEALIRQLREMATEFAADNKTDCKQHVCWIAANRLSGVAQTPQSTIEDWSCAADFLDDIEVDAKGMCRWADVANAQTHIRCSLRSVQAALRNSAPQETRGDEPESVSHYVENYRFEFEDGRSYTPNEQDKALLEDAIEGWHTLAAAQQSPRLEREGLRNDAIDIFHRYRRGEIKSADDAADAILALRSPDTTVVSSTSHCEVGK